MKLTNQQIFTVSEAIAKLDGQQVTQLIEGKAVAVFKSHQIAAVARWSLARAQGLLQAAIADFTRAKDALINQYSAGKGQLAANDPAIAKFQKELSEMLAAEVDLPIDPITPDDLKLEANEKAGSEIPIAVLTALTPLIQAA